MLNKFSMTRDVGDERMPVFFRYTPKTGMAGEKIANAPPLQSRAGWKGKEVKTVRK